MSTDKEFRKSLLREALKKSDNPEKVLPLVASWVNFINNGDLKGVTIPAKTESPKQNIPTKRSKPKKAAAPIKSAKVQRKGELWTPSGRLSAKMHKDGGTRWNDESKAAVAAILVSIGDINEKAVRKTGRSLRSLRQANYRRYFEPYGFWHQNRRMLNVLSSCNVAAGSFISSQIIWAPHSLH